MVESEIAFGDKLFLYGKLLQYLHEFEAFEYNSVLGYMTVGGYDATAIETTTPDTCVPGFITEFLYSPSLAPKTPFPQMEMVDVTDKLSLRQPLPSSTKVWMPVTRR